jgi:hypothetical protein
MTMTLMLTPFENYFFSLMRKGKISILTEQHLIGYLSVTGAIVA